MKNMEKYSPQDYVKAYQNLKKNKRKQISDSNKEILAVRQKVNAHRAEYKATKNELDSKYFVRSIGNVNLFLDRIELGQNVIMFEDCYSITTDKQYETVVVGYYKNGKPKTRTVSYSVVSISSNTTSINIRAGSTLNKAKRLAAEIKAEIESGANRKRELDKEGAKLDKSAQSLAKRDKKELAEVLERAESAKNKISKKIAEFLESGTEKQRQALFRKSRIVLLCTSILIGLPVLIASVAGFVHITINILEANYNYDIIVADELSYDCELFYNEPDHSFYCTQREYGGEANYSNNAFLSTWRSGYNLSIDGKSFRKEIPQQIIPSSYWASKDLSLDKIQEDYGSSEDQLIIYNRYLERVVAEKRIVIHWYYSEEDLKLINETWTKWKSELETKAQKRYDDFLIEEEARRAEEERKKEEEIRKQNEEAQKKAEEEAKKKAEEEAENSQKPAQSTPSTNNSGSGVKGYCKDGTPAYGNPSARGRANSCYGHGGWVR